MADLLSTIGKAITDALAPSADGPYAALPLPSSLVGVGDRLGNGLTVGTDPSAAGLERWLAEFRRLVGDVAVRETIAVRVLQVRLPRLAEALALVGAIVITWEGSGENARVRHLRVNWARLGQVVSDPGQVGLTTLLSRAGGLGDVKSLQVLLLLLAGDPLALLRLEYAGRGFLALPTGDGVGLGDLIEEVNSPVYLGLPDRAVTTQEPAGIRLVSDGPDIAVPAGTLGTLSLGAVLPASLRPTGAVTLAPGWVLRLESPGGGDLRIVLACAGTSFDTDVRSSAPVTLTASPTTAPAADAFLLGRAEGTHVSVGNASVALSLRTEPGTPLFTWLVTLSPVRFGLATDVLGPIGSGLPLPPLLTFAADVATSFAQGTGLSAGGAGASLGVEFTHALGLVVGGPGAGLRVDTVLTRLELAVTGGGLFLRVVLRLTARAELGPVSATVSEAGAWLGRWTTGNAGLLPPRGIGLVIAAGPVSGGGFLGELAPGEYGGALALKVLGIGAFAWGIYQQLPDGSTSVAVLIGVRLPPPGIQVGFGFAISGLGGLVGVNRRADLDRLREKLGSGTAGDVLFTDDPVKNAPRLLGELRTLFPAARGTHVVGPTIQVNWLYLLRLDIGLFVELPTGKFFLAGTGRYVVGTDDFALVRLRLDFVGGVDPTKSLVFFDGQLVDSSVLGVIRITGGISFRLGFGASAYFVYSVGGFHPAFDARTLDVPHLPRAGASVSLGIVWLRQEVYLAVTSTSYQFGTNTEAGIKVGPIKVHGWVRFDALIQLRPFHFTAAIDAGMAAECKGVEFASIRVRGELSGPGPLVLRASGSVRVLVRISKSVTITLDGSPPEHLPEIPNLAEHLRPELDRQANLRCDGADVDVQFGGAADAALVIPVGGLVWEQRRVPLNQLVERAEGRPLRPARTVSVTVGGWATTPERDRFGHGTFASLSAADQLAAPTFVEAVSGFRLAGADRFGSAPTRVDAPLTTTVVRLPGRSRLSALLAWYPEDGLATLLQRSGGIRVADEPPVVGVRAEPWLVGEASTDSFGQPFSAASAYSASRHTGAVAAPVSTPTVSTSGVF